MNPRMQKYADLVERGCTCGAEDYTPCPLHAGGSDNRGIRAFFEAGMPRGFPMKNCRCMVCGTEGCLIYQDVNQLDPSKPFVHRPTLICPKCSAPAAERALVAECEAFGIELNDARIFPLAVAA